MGQGSWRYDWEILRKLDGIAHGVDMLRLEVKGIEAGSGRADDRAEYRLERMHDDVRSLLERREKSGGSGSVALVSAISGGIGGFLLCGGLAMALGLVDGRDLRGVWQPEPASVSGVERRAVGVHIDVVPGPEGGTVETQPFALPPEYLRELERLDERRAREAVDAKPFPEGPGEVEPPPLGKTGEEARMGRGPEEYAGRREDSLGLHSDLPMDAAP